MVEIDPYSARGEVRSETPIDDIERMLAFRYGKDIPVQRHEIRDWWEDMKAKGWTIGMMSSNLGAWEMEEMIEDSQAIRAPDKEGRGRGNTGIWEFNQLSELRDRIRSLYRDCREREGFTWEIEDILVVGSYGRGDARKGDSDIDIKIFVDTRGEDVGAEVLRLDSCIEESGNDIIRGYEDWFDDVEVGVELAENKDIVMEQQLIKRKFYSLEQMEIIELDNSRWFIG